MGRRFAILLLCVIAWAGVARLIAASARPASMGAAPQMQGASTEDGGQADGRWTAGRRAVTSVTESNWKSSTPHAVLAGAPSLHTLGDTLVVTRRERPDPTRPAHLRPTPLLI